MRRILNFIFLLALLPFVGWAQQKNYYGQHVSIKLTTGDSIQYDLRYPAFNGPGKFKPIIKDGKTSWSFISALDRDGNYQIDDNEANNPGELFAIDNVESIDFRSFEDDEKVVKEALTDFYHAMNGDNWPEKYRKNWCSDKPIWEWYGVNGCTESSNGYVCPWVDNLTLNHIKQLSGQLPECFERMGPIGGIDLSFCNITGELPASLSKSYSLTALNFDGNKLTGTIPEGMENLPHHYLSRFDGNQMEGPLPEKYILSWLNAKDGVTGNNFTLIGNSFSGKVPQSIQQHPRFNEFWPGIVIGSSLDFSDLVIPAPPFSIKDINGDIIDLAETYKKNKYTLLYNWRFSCPWSEIYNQRLIPAYNAYKDKGFEVIGLHHDLNFDDGLSDYLQDHDIPWKNSIAKDWGYVLDWTWLPTAQFAIMQFGGTPQVFLVDQNGNIVFNSLMDEKGKDMMKTMYRNELFNFLEEKLGPVDYNFYTSTDYSQDGEVTTLHTATTGQGFDMVFVGEGFTDKDIADGTFDQRMNEALNQFFAYEPYSSLRDRINVYAVKAVSPNAEFYGGGTHAIDEDPAKALEYASKVTTLIPDRPMRVNVIYNNVSGGRSYCMMMEDDSYICYVMDGVSTVLNHEAGGHGIGKLLDEYVETGNETKTLPEENKTDLEDIWTTLGWGANVDWRSDPTEVKWAKFISDSRYADEKIGLYEGSYLYQYGAYRPTENSMMRYNDTPFNAPSREEIYKRVMKESEGDSWTYDYETFVAFDASGHEQYVNSIKSTSRARGENAPKVQPVQRTAPPVFLKGTWRDALNKKQK